MAGLNKKSQEVKRKLNIKGFVLATAKIFGAVVFLTGLANLIWPAYANAFLQIMASVYPGYDASGSFGDLVIGSLYAFLDGAVVGLVFSWLYNFLLGKLSTE